MQWLKHHVQHPVGWISPGSQLAHGGELTPHNQGFPHPRQGSGSPSIQSPTTSPPKTKSMQEETVGELAVGATADEGSGPGGAGTVAGAWVCFLLATRGPQGSGPSGDFSVNEVVNLPQSYTLFCYHLRH